MSQNDILALKSTYNIPLWGHRVRQYALCRQCCEKFANTTGISLDTVACGNQIL